MKRISHFILFILTSFFLSGCTIWDNYREAYKREHMGIGVTYVSGSLQGSLYTLPDKKNLDRLVREIDTAKYRVWVELYIWSEKTTREAVIRAKNRGVDVRVILEPNVYNIPRINDETKEMLSGANIPVIFSSQRYTFTHIKMWIIDDMGCVGTGNWSYTTFTKNREFIYCSPDGLFLSNLEEVFLSDFSHLRPIFASGGLDSRIGLSPENMRKWLSEEIGLAKERIIIWNQTISDREILALLNTKQRQGVRVELCQAKKDTPIENPTDMPIADSNGPYLHAKIMLVDTGTLILGSANMTENAIERNREIMIKIIDNPELQKQIEYIYDKDCKSQG